MVRLDGTVQDAPQPKQLIEHARCGLVCDWRALNIGGDMVARSRELDHIKLSLRCGR
jgi:hypothetical protein